MKRYSFAVIAALSGTALSLAQEAPVPPDVEHAPSLQKPVTEKLSMAPLSAVVKALSKDSGAAIEVTTAISDLKATVLVKDQPVGVVMARLADVFHGEWRQSGSSYRLSIPSDWSSKESAFVRAEDDVRRKEAEAALRAIAGPTNISYQQVLQELANEKTTAKRKEELERVKTPGAYLLGYTFAHLGNAQLQAFWLGKPVRASVFLPSVDAGTAATPPNGVIGRRPPRGNRVPPQDPAEQAGTFVRAFATFNPITGELRTSEAAVASGRGDGGGLLAQPYPSGELANLPFAKDVLAWSKVEEENPILKAAFSGQAPAGSYFNGQHSLGDILTWVHEKTNVPIVADAFRVPVRPPGGSNSIAALLENLSNLNHEYLRTQNGFVMMRQGGFWRLKTFEVPEDAYQQIESAKTPGLNDYAGFAGNLKPAQTIVFRVQNAVLTRFDPEPLRVGMPALRFYASLGSGERQAALAGQALPFGRLSNTSKELFLDALSDSAGRPLGAGALNPDDPRVAANMGFLLSSSTAERLVATQPGFASRSLGSAKKMLFGTSTKDGVQFVIPVD